MGGETPVHLEQVTMKESQSSEILLVSESVMSFHLKIFKHANNFHYQLIYLVRHSLSNNRLCDVKRGKEYQLYILYLPNKN